MYIEWALWCDDIVEENVGYLCSGVGPDACIMFEDVIGTEVPFQFMLSLRWEDGEQDPADCSFMAIWVAPDAAYGGDSYMLSSTSKTRERITDPQRHVQPFVVPARITTSGDYRFRFFSERAGEQFRYEAVVTVTLLPVV